VARRLTNGVVHPRAGERAIHQEIHGVTSETAFAFGARYGCGGDGAWLRGNRWNPHRSTVSNVDLRVPRPRVSADPMRVTSTVELAGHS
jgi:hypothetical protein